MVHWSSRRLEVDVLLIKTYKLTFFVILKKYPNWLLDSNFIDFPASRPKSLAACIQNNNSLNSKLWIKLNETITLYNALLNEWEKH